MVMTPISFKGEVCWKSNRISEVINIQAVSINTPEFLATHAPFKEIQYLRMPSQQPNTSEETFLRELIDQAEKNQHVFAVIQGIPGTGKSHLIRWLKEKYAQIVKTDVILLIERSNSSLHKTLNQIANSNLFNAQEFKDDLQRLLGAADQLSNEGLMDSILNNLQLATQENGVLPIDQIPSKKIARHIKEFLLDPTIRDWLKRDNGPIKRIYTHISKGRDSGVLVDEAPGFTSEDFIVPISLLNKCDRAGINDLAKLFARLLNDSEEEALRQELALYLTRLLSFTIGHTMSLSTENLKEMFYKLRRNLKEQGKNLTLFIEDITAFTGIDAALIDVLVTQHTGVGDKEFCRIISVIGITDSFYSDHFPRNFQERITHHLVLNQAAINSESSLLKTSEDTADLVARYLNAMRLDSSEIQQWFDQGGDIHSLPNPCSPCQFREVCHSAFGSVDLVENDHSGRYKVGLYPFNENAIWTMFGKIDTNQASKTPRSLLQHVLQYVLLSHGLKIKSGKFPPPQNELGSVFKAPMLNEPTQSRVIREQGGMDADRIETLVLFWGDRSINNVIVNGKYTIGGLSPVVFESFSIPMIIGASGGKPAPSSPPPTSSPPLLPPGEKDIKYVEDLRSWVSGGRMNYYEDFARWLTGQVEAFYDWEAYGISRSQMKERVKPGKFVFERQFGKISSPNITFECNEEMQMVLLALVDLNKNMDVLNSGTIGSHLATLGMWLRQQETNIINFVQRSSSEEESVSLLELTFFDTLLCSILEGGISSDSPTDLFRSMIKSSRSNMNWKDLEEKSEGIRSTAWMNLVKRLRTEDITQTRESWMQLINHPQGRGEDVKFVDAARIFDLIEILKKNNWDLPEYDLSNIQGDTNWERTGQLYQDLQTYFKKAVEGEKSALEARLKALSSYLGKANEEDVFTAIATTLTTLQNNQRHYRFQLKFDLTANGLTATSKTLADINSSNTYLEQVLGLSSCLDQIKILKDYNDYFAEYVKEIEELEKNLQKETEGSKSQDQIDEAIQEAESLYEDVDHILSRAISTSKKREVT
jgi:hypothetical protein